jgi:sugar O-acyltransferase (sialic acid O-acetyltransferase NeuD family)
MTEARPLLLMGGGGHASVVAESARAAGWSIAGFLDDRPEGTEASALGVEWLGVIGDLHTVLERLADAAVHAAMGDNELRRRWSADAGRALAPPIVHPSAVVSPSATLADGVFIAPRAVVNARAVIERGAIVNSGAIVEHDCRLGAFCHVAPGVALGGNVSVGEQALVGIGATVIPGRRIGARATLGAAAVAIRDVPEGTTAVGFPARILAAAQGRT